MSQDPLKPVPPVYKSRGGIGRVFKAAGYSVQGLRAAIQHEAAFRQELLVGLPLVVLALWLQPGRWQTLALVGSVVLVWVVELLNSAVEALADSISTQHHPLLGRAKDLGSAAVMLCLLGAVAIWGLVLWP